MRCASLMVFSQSLGSRLVPRPREKQSGPLNPENARARRVCEINKKNTKKKLKIPKCSIQLYSRIIPSFESAKDISRPVKIRVLRICSLVVFGGTVFLLL